MSNGNPDPGPPQPSGEMKKIRIVMTAEGYGTSEKEWLVPEELVRPYAIVYDAAISAVGLKVSDAIYEAIGDLPGQEVENFLARPMINAAKDI